MDASVVVKWVLSGEAYEESAVKLKDDHLSRIVELCAPSFLVQEVANSLWKAVKLGGIREEKAQEALNALNDMNLILYELDWAQISRVLIIACKLDSAIYDAAYLFLSGKMKAQFVTADNKLYEKAKKHFSVLHIRDY